MMNNKNQSVCNARKLALTKAFPVMLGIAFLGVGYGVYMRSCGFDIIWPNFYGCCYICRFNGVYYRQLTAEYVQSRLRPASNVDRER